MAWNRGPVSREGKYGAMMTEAPRNRVEMKVRSWSIACSTSSRWDGRKAASLRPRLTVTTSGSQRRTASSQVLSRHDGERWPPGRSREEPEAVSRQVHLPPPLVLTHQ